MGTVEINDLSRIGAVADVPGYQLPPEAFTTILNMRIQDQGLVNLLGWEGVFGTPTVAPHFLAPISTAALNYWVYTSLTKAYVWNGSSHTNITRQSVGVDVDYTASAGKDWNKTLLANILILNNGTDVPQFWATPDVGTKLANLTNWDSNVRAKIIRAFGPFLIAFNLTVSGVSKPHLARWSHPASPGSVPSSWDNTDPTLDTGEADLPDVNSGVIQEALPLGSTMFIYKGSSTWKMRFVGGRSKFDFGNAPWLPTVGALAARCVAITGDGLWHVVATADDIVRHNGNTVKSVLNMRQKRLLANDLDSTSFDTSFMFTNPYYNEVWFCYPSAGSSFPDKAIIMQYGNGDEWQVMNADGITFRHADVGMVESPSDETWEDNPTETWDEDTGPWSTFERRRVLGAGTADTKIFKLDSSIRRNGSTFNTTLQRVGLSVLGQKRDGGWIVDHEVEKMLRRLWPKVQGGPVRVRVGAQQLVNGPVTWGSYTSFDPSSQITADILPVSGRANAVEFSTEGGVSWRIDGYKTDVVKLGRFGE